MNTLDRRDYEVSWSSESMSYNYNGKVKVWAIGSEDAKERAIEQVHRDMCISRSMINIKEIKEI